MATFERARARAVSRLAVAMIVAVLSGCGFHLQGHTELPRSLALARVETKDSQTDFYATLRASLLRAGAQPDDATKTAATIHILEDTVTEQVLTVSARNIPTAYQLSYHIKVSVDAQGHELLAPEEHTLTREYSFDERAVLAKDREREALTQALADDLAAMIMRRLAAL